MKTLLITAALAVATAGSAFAQVTANDLPANVRWEVQRLVPNADLDTITRSQAVQIRSFFGNSDDDSASSSVLRGHIQRILGEF